MTDEPTQDKESEKRFFDQFGKSEAYNVFSDSANSRLIDAFLRLTGLQPGARIVDLGCGSGIFTNLIAERGVNAEGVDLSPELVARARREFPALTFTEGDVEKLPFPDACFDGVLLSGLIHHLPNPTLCAREVARVLKPGGKFFAFDPNRMNPFMYLYRDRSSWFYSSKGVTPNERPILANEVAQQFASTGLRVQTAYLGALPYRYVESPIMRAALPVYNALDTLISAPPFMARFRPFVLTHGERP